MYPEDIMLPDDVEPECVWSHAGCNSTLLGERAACYSLRCRRQIGGRRLTQPRLSTFFEVTFSPSFILDCQPSHRVPGPPGRADPWLPRSGPERRQRAAAAPNRGRTR